MYADMIFKFGYVHCDPHPGNVLVRKNPSTGQDEVVLLDHGLYSVRPLTILSSAFLKFLQSFLLVATDQRLPVGLLPFLAEHIERGHGRDQDLCGQARRGPTVRTFRLHGRRTVVELNHQRN